MKPAWLAFAAIATLSPLASARLIETKSLNSCQDNSSFTATLFNVVFTPDNGSLAFNIVGVSSISGYVVAEIEVTTYGFQVTKQTLDPCALHLDGMCPMFTGPVKIQSNINNISPSVINRIPSIAYGWPDLDGLVKITIMEKATNNSVVCVEAELSNGKTVDQKGVGWTTAVIAGLALLASAVTSGLGHSNTAAHVAANALSLFGFFQAQATIGMTAVHLPSIVAAWSQNLQWTLGIIQVDFLEAVCTWYQRSTGGTPSTLLSNLNTASVQVQKRSVDLSSQLVSKSSNELSRRATTTTAAATPGAVVVVQGIKRVGFVANIETTNIFLTGLIFFMLFVGFTALSVALFKGFCEVAVKAGWFKGDKFEEFRTGWKIVLKGILFRLVLIGYTQICILCLWELTQRDSAAEVVLALFFFVSMSVALGWASLKVFRIATRSVAMHKNPAYILYSDPSALNKWGFLYVQFRATAYYFIMPMLVHILLKSLFIAFAQGSGTAQAIGLVIIEAAFLIGVSILRPWMDKKTNAFNISIAVINFVNAIFLLIFSNVFNQPGMVSGVLGVVYFFMNAIFAAVLLLLVFIATVYAVVSKNPDTRYQPMHDDRGSFIKSQTQLNTELDALGVTARGDMAQKGYYSRDLDGDDSSFSSGSGKNHFDAAGVPLPPSTANSARNNSLREPPRSPIDPNMQYLPSDGSPRHGTPQYGMYNNDNSSSRPGADMPLMNSWTDNRSRNQSPYRNAPPSSNLNPGYRQQNNSSPWQRGAGYDH